MCIPLRRVQQWWCTNMFEVFPGLQSEQWPVHSGPWVPCIRVCGMSHGVPPVWVEPVREVPVVIEQQLHRVLIQCWWVFLLSEWVLPLSIEPVLKLPCLVLVVHFGCHMHNLSEWLLLNSQLAMLTVWQQLPDMQVDRPDLRELPLRLHFEWHHLHQHGQHHHQNHSECRPIIIIG